jgi:Fur family peroxide stress response transcriptional regulator
MIETAQALKDAGLKATPQRLAIFHMLYNTKVHPSAEMIYTSLHETHPTMSLATVYKTLDALVKTNLVQQLNVGEDSYRYDCNTHMHPHIICTSCNRVFDIELEGVSSLREQVKEATGFNLFNEQLYFYGECPDCQEKK